MATEPPESPVRSLSSPPWTERDDAFVGSLQEAGLLSELSPELLSKLQARSGAQDDDARRLDIVVAYFGGSDSEGSALRRIAQDRFFLHRDDDETSAKELVVRLAALTPEVGGVNLERIGSDEGPLVLRAGEHFSAVADEEEHLDTGEIDLSELDASPTVMVRSLVGAINVLLERCDVRQRLIPLPGDGKREAYVAAGVAEAMILCQAGCLEEDDPEQLMDFCGW